MNTVASCAGGTVTLGPGQRVSAADQDCLSDGLNVAATLDESIAMHRKRPELIDQRKRRYPMAPAQSD